MTRHGACFLIITLLTVNGRAMAIDCPPWSRGRVDDFVQAGHQQAGVVPAMEAPRRTLIRRLSLDLLGLPPSPAEVDTFVNDNRPDAYDQLVERLLASPRFGERMAQFWLDLARYADSDGYHDDTNRAMWPYRDWVIDAFNQNKPFDEFTVEQLAGDLLPNATLQQQIATAFHRNGPTTSEDGANPEEYRVRYAVDRLNTTAMIWLGMTAQCAECHDHKYDPMTIREYYQLLAFFNQIPEQPLYRGLYAPPSIAVPNEQQFQRLVALSNQIAQEKEKLCRQSEKLRAPQSLWQQQLASHVFGEPNRATDEFLFRGQGIKQFENTGIRQRPAKPRAAEQQRAPSPADGLTDHALRFIPNGAALDLKQSVEFRCALAFTIEAWIQHSGDGGTLISKVDPYNHSRGFDVRILDNRIAVRLVDQWPDKAVQVSTKNRYPADTWFHVAVTYEGLAAPESIHIHINGEPQDLRVDVAKEVQTIRNQSNLIVGGGADSESSFHGAIDELRFHKTPFSSRALLETPLRKLQELVRLDARSSSADALLARYFRDSWHGPTAGLVAKIRGLEQKREELTHALPRLRVMRDAAQRRPTYVLRRGDFRDRGEEVQASTPTMFPPMRKRHAAPPYASRLDFAYWLVEENSRQTARVTVNRIWALLFGRGLVSTLDDFGVQGEPPSHPELLDWLAEAFVQSEWDVKWLIRQLVHSSTYRQTSAVTQEEWDRDPTNTLLARATRRRLSAEVIRDNTLEISGLLIDELKGPSVRPYQPPGLWEEMAKGDEPNKTYEQSHGSDLYRRGIYTFWKRSIHYPAFAIFDAPNRETCTSSRPTTNTPLQALGLLNDPTMIEAARAFAESVLRSRSDTRDIAFLPTKGSWNGSLQENDFFVLLQFAFQRALARSATSEEAAEMYVVFKDFDAEYRASRQATAKLLAVGELPVAADLPRAELAAWTALAQIILTMDETITRE